MSFNWIDYFYINTESHTGEAILALIKNVTQKDFFLADRLDAVTTTVQKVRYTIRYIFGYI